MNEAGLIDMQLGEIIPAIEVSILCFSVFPCALFNGLPQTEKGHVLEEHSFSCTNFSCA